MLITAQATDFENPPAGVHAARCYRLIDLGSQKSTYQGETKTARKLLLSFELLSDDPTERMSDGRPFTVSRRFTQSLGDKAALRHFVESWRGRAFTPEELAQGFDVNKLLGAHAFLNLVETEREGRDYTNIASISPLPKGMTKPEGVNAVQLFDLSAPDWAVFEGLGDRLKEQISASPEYKAATQTKPPASSDTFNDDDIPF